MHFEFQSTFKHNKMKLENETNNTTPPSSSTTAQEAPSKNTDYSWVKNSITIKLAIITVLTLLLLIPNTMVRNIILEREALNKRATSAVSQKWAEEQLVNGPILTIPLSYTSEVNGKTVSSKKMWHILPNNLKVKGSVNPEKLRLGIYEMVVYKSDLAFSGDFKLDHDLDQSDLSEIHYDQAFLTLGVSDLRGIKNQIQFKWGNTPLSVEAGSKIKQLIQSGITIKVPNLSDSSAKKVNFKFNLALHGSKQLSFIPLGGNTEIDIHSPWNSPSFTGKFLPDTRELTNDGFQANWKILQLNRNFNQSLVMKDYGNVPANAHLAVSPASSEWENISNSAFGVNLILPLDDYQKTLRSVKYAIMTIALTFLIFFLVEVLTKRKIHPFQYVLVGLALCLFYILLISITEHSNFNTAFGISALSIISLIAFYSLSVFKAKKYSLLLLLVLTSIYGFLFVNLQLTDYALLMGSAGLIIILGLTMYATRNIDWYKINFENK